MHDPLIPHGSGLFLRAVDHYVGLHVDNNMHNMAIIL